MIEEKAKVVQYNETIAAKIGAAFLTYLGGLLVSIAVGAICGYGAAWFCILMHGVSDELVAIICSVFPTCLTRIVTRRGNVMTAFISAIGAFVAIYVMFWTIDGQGLSWTDKDSVWDEFWFYAGIAAVVGAILGFVKGDSKKRKNEIELK